MSANCTRCGSNQVIRNSRVDMAAGSYRVNVLLFTGAQGAPGSWWDKKAVHGTVTRCDICCACGAVTFRVDEPQQLWNA